MDPVGLTKGIFIARFGGGAGGNLLLFKNTENALNKKIMQWIHCMETLLEHSSLASKLDLARSSRHIHYWRAGRLFSLRSHCQSPMSNACPFIQTLGVFDWVLQIFPKHCSPRATVSFPAPGTWWQTQLTSSVSLPLLGTHGNQLKMKSIGRLC